MIFPLNNDSMPTGPLAGSRRQSAQGGLVVNYADVLAQAVANERNRLLHDIEAAIEAIPTRATKPQSSWDMADRSPESVKQDALRAVRYQRE